MEPCLPARGATRPTWLCSVGFLRVLREIFFGKEDTIDVWKFNSKFPVRFSFPGNSLRILMHLIGCQGNKRPNRCDATGMTELGRLEKVELLSNEGPPAPLFMR